MKLWLWIINKLKSSYWNLAYQQGFKDGEVKGIRIGFEYGLDEAIEEQAAAQSFKQGDRD